MERVFYFSGYRMTVFDWDGKRLISSLDFQPDEEGLDAFEHLLDKSVRMPARLLVDMIEEDFRREVIPHVNMFDRPALVQRQIDRHYRDEDYVHAKVIGRSKLGRRDDNVLLSALTNTGVLSPWLDRLKTFDVRLAGIWSLPLLTEKLLRPILNDDENALIVSRQVRSALRNSFFKDGKLLLSRQAKFDKEMWDKNSFEGVIANLERGTLEIHNFLVNQRIMEPKDHLNVYCILNDDQLEEARQLSHNTERVHYAFISLEQLFKHFGVQDCENQGAAALFSYLCSHVNSLTDHYATQEQKSTYYRYLIDRFITQVAETGSLICITAAVVLALRSMELDQSQVTVSRETGEMAAEYAGVYGAIETQLGTATMVQDAVQMFNKLNQDASQSPHNYFLPLSRVLGQPRFSSIMLKELQWKKYSRGEIRQIILSEKLQRQDQGNLQAQDNLVNEFQLESETDSRSVQTTLSLKGEINTRGLTYRATIRKMESFVSQLEQIPDVQSVLLVQTAVDIRDSSRFTDQIGAQPESGSDTNTKDFEVLVVFEQAGGVERA